MNYQRLSSLNLIIYNCGSLHVYKLMLRKQYALNLNTFFMREKTAISFMGTAVNRACLFSNVMANETTIA